LITIRITVLSLQEIAHKEYNMSFESRALGVLERMNVKVGGDRPQDIHVHHPAVYRKVLMGGTLALGDAYVNGEWSANQLDVFFAHIINTPEARSMQGVNTWRIRLASRLMNIQSRARAFMVGEHHYDVGNDIYECMLGDIRAYTCGYRGRGAKTLKQMQFDKHQLICEKLHLTEGQRILDIGCGNGEFMYHALVHGHARQVVGVSVSREQTKLAMQRNKGLSARFRILDYRLLNPVECGQFDRVVSIGMAEHVGCKNFGEYMAAAHRMLRPDGLFLLHTITSNTTQDYGDGWLSRRIFPGGVLPSVATIAKSAEPYFVIEDVHNFGADYDWTLMFWYRNLLDNRRDIEKRYDERFFRMWEYYLLQCAGLFRSRHIQLQQFVLSPNGVSGGYTSVR